MVTPVTIGVVARERFSTAARSVRRLLEATPRPFRLVIVDAGTPPRYRQEMERAVAGQPDVDILRTPDYLNPNAAKNWIVRESSEGDFLALIENDNLVSPGWLECLIRACDGEQAGVARPMLYESRLFRVTPHFDTRWDRLEAIDGPDGRAYRFHARTAPLSADVRAPRARTTVLETHCLLFRRAALEKIGPFDERLNTRQELDVALQLHAAGIPVVFEPAATVTYLSPPPVHADEREFFHARWNYATAIESHQIITAKWRTLNLPNSLDFVRARREFVSYPRYIAFRLRARLSAITARLRRGGEGGH